MANVRTFLQRNPVTFPIVHDASQQVVGRYGAPRMPTSYILDRNGIVRHRQDGFHASEAARLEQRVRALLSQR
jgi:peroxiredoxin